VAPEEAERYWKIKASRGDRKRCGVQRGSSILTIGTRRANEGNLPIFGLPRRESFWGYVAASISAGMTGQMRGRFANFI
jgi:hypothetical protein